MENKTSKMRFIEFNRRGINLDQITAWEFHSKPAPDEDELDFYQGDLLVTTIRGNAAKAFYDYLIRNCCLLTWRD